MLKIMLNNTVIAAFLCLSACAQGPHSFAMTAPEGVQQPRHDSAFVKEPQMMETAPMPVVEEVAAPKPVMEKAVEKPKNAEKTVEMSDTPVEMAAPMMESPVSHDALDSLLQKYVSATGKVNYKGLKADKQALYDYCTYLSENPVQDDWSRAAQMAYWINAYNAFTLKLIVDNYPTKSILNFDGGKTWDVKRIKIGDKKYSLNNIENDILRPKFKDARIHFAVNCAAKSCPPLWSHAYTAENLESTLEARAKAFINNTSYNNISATKASVSKIFDWYGVDFGDLKKFLNRYAKLQLKSNAVVSFEEYNWDLNE